MARIALIASIAAAASAAKVSMQLARQLEANDATDIMVQFESNTRVASASFEHLPVSERAQAVFDFLNNENIAATTSAVKVASEFGLDAKQYWISPMVHIKGANKDVVAKISALPGVAKVGPVEVYELPVLKEVAPAAGNGTEVEWGVKIIDAPTVWARGNKGKGIVVANIDTGVRGTHETLKNNFRAANGWYEPATNSSAPNDRHGHGTHTMGTIAGGNGIGVAPEAQWIACVGCPAGSCPQTDLLACAQWIVCPTDTNGKNPNCKLAPHLVSNSWGSTQNGNTWYENSILAWRKAGIIPVFSNGNAGPSCGTVGSPGDSPSVIAVGATDSADALASFSSKGPEPLQKRIKPDVSAPGKNVRSAGSAGDSTYVSMSGTSMAAPHVAGAVALILAAKPGASYDDVYKALASTADTASLKPSGKNCGGVDDSKYPNNDYGFGRINVNKASNSKPAC